MKHFLGNTVIAQVLDAGFNLDFIDADAVDNLGIPYKVLILPGVDRIPVKTYEKIEAFARHGGIVIATRRLPATAPGFLNRDTESRRIQEISQALFQHGCRERTFVEDESSLGASLSQYLEPDFTTTPKIPAIGFIHRKLANADLYFLANTSNQPQRFTAHFRSARKHAELWDPFSGETRALPRSQEIEFQLAPYESRLVFFSDAGTPNQPVRHSAPIKTVNLSTGWQIAFEDAPDNSISMHSLASWENMPQRQFYSGRAVYRKQLTLSPSDLRAGGSLTLNFGEGTPIPLPDPLHGPNMRAYLESPIREAAQVFVNGKSAGYVWHPPFEVNVTSFVHAGSNEIKVLVGNTAINTLAGHPLPDYRLLNARYGVRFIPQDMDNLNRCPRACSGLSRSSKAAPHTSTKERFMQRVAFLLRLKPGTEAAYDDAHRHVWPEMLALLKRAGISDYSIFRRGELLVLTMTIERDFETTWREIERDPVNTRWQQAMSDYFAPMDTTLPGERFPMMQEVFYLP